MTAPSLPLGPKGVYNDKLNDPTGQHFKSRINDNTFSNHIVGRVVKIILYPDLPVNDLFGSYEQFQKRTSLSTLIGAIGQLNLKLENKLTWTSAAFW